MNACGSDLALAAAYPHDDGRRNRDIAQPKAEARVRESRHGGYHDEFQENIEIPIDFLVTPREWAPKRQPDKVRETEKQWFHKMLRTNIEPSICTRIVSSEAGRLIL